MSSHPQLPIRFEYQWRARSTILLAMLFGCNSETPLQPAGSAADAAQQAKQPAMVAAAATLSNRFAYAWADNATAASYTPKALYSYNAAGGSITVTHAGPGSGYAVTFGGLTRAGVGGTETFVVTPYGSTGAHCVAGFYIDNGVSTTVNVFCIDPVQGLGTDSRFTILAVGSGSLASRSAFAYANSPGALSYTPDPNFSYTSAGTAIGITHDTLPGSYLVNFGTGNPAGSNVQVNSRLTPTECLVAEFKSATVRVRCFDSFTSAPADADFQVLQVTRGRPGRRFGFAFADRPGLASYTPNPSFAFNSSGGGVKATRSSLGHYSVVFAGLQKPTGHTEIVQVTPFAVAYANCSLLGWGSSSAGLKANIECRDIAGNFRNTKFEILVIE